MCNYFCQASHLSPRAGLSAFPHDRFQTSPRLSRYVLEALCWDRWGVSVCVPATRQPRASHKTGARHAKPYLSQGVLLHEQYFRTCKDQCTYSWQPYFPGPQWPTCLIGPGGRDWLFNVNNTPSIAQWGPDVLSRPSLGVMTPLMALKTHGLQRQLTKLLPAPIQLGFLRNNPVFSETNRSIHYNLQIFSPSGWPISSCGVPLWLSWSVQRSFLPLQPLYMRVQVQHMLASLLSLKIWEIPQQPADGWYFPLKHSPVSLDHNVL